MSSLRRAVPREACSPSGGSERSERGGRHLAICVTIQSTSSCRRRPASPNGASAAWASARSPARAAARRRAEQRHERRLVPRRVLAGGLAERCGRPFDVEESSTTWNASPAARANRSSAVECEAVSVPAACARRAVPLRGSARRSSCGASSRARAAKGVLLSLSRSIACPPAMPARARGIARAVVHARPRVARARFRPSSWKASACSASPARSAVASSNATWHVRLAAAQRVVVHARQVVVDERVRVDQLDGGRGVHRRRAGSAPATRRRRTRAAARTRLPPPSVA